MRIFLPGIRGNRTCGFPVSGFPTDFVKWILFQIGICRAPTRGAAIYSIALAEVETFAEVGDFE
jgi:hypothetical protein